MVEFKKKFSDTNAKLKEKLFALHEIQTKLDEVKKEVQREHQAERQKLLEEKTKEVEEKLKTKRRLTTEDLIILQGRNL